MLMRFLLMSVCGDPKQRYVAAAQLRDLDSQSWSPPARAPSYSLAPFSLPSPIPLALR